MNHAELLPKLTEIYANRAERVMFVKGDDDVNFRYIADVIDIGKAANVDHIGLMTPKIHGRPVAGPAQFPSGTGREGTTAMTMNEQRFAAAYPLRST